MATAKPTFFERMTQGSRLARAAWRVILILLLFNVVMGIWSGYAAWVQVRKLDLAIATANLRPGMPAIVHVVSSGRTFVTVRLELIQGTHSEMLAQLRVAPSHWSVYDPRARPATMTPNFTTEFLAQFQPGPAILRATATGGPQWTRTPPPVVTEVPVVIANR
jgi:hypothetical protein